MKAVANRIVQSEDGIQSCPDCGAILSDIRSLEHLRCFFGFLRHCFESWPEEGEFLPDDPEHLRAWLLVKIKHRQPHHVFKFANRREMQIAMGVLNEEMRADRARGVYGWVVQCEGGLTILRPASIAIHGSKAISEKKFCEITDRVFKFILDYAGIDFDAWKEMGKPTRRAA